MDNILRIVIADDAMIMRRNLSVIFTEAGYQVVGEAKNGVEALNLYRKFKPDLITLDINMPIMNGIEALKAIKEEFPKAKVIMISSQGQEHLVYEAIKAGAVNFLLKPVVTAKVLQVVREIIG